MEPGARSTSLRQRERVQRVIFSRQPHGEEKPPRSLPLPEEILRWIFALDSSSLSDVRWLRIEWRRIRLRGSNLPVRMSSMSSADTPASSRAMVRTRRGRSLGAFGFGVRKGRLQLPEFGLLAVQGGTTVVGESGTKS